MKQQRQRPIQAAEYVRMSTDQQQYSIAAQQSVIRTYATEHDITIVRTYMDAGKSGLTLSQRPGLRQLLDDVERGKPGYSVVLVYDVSRWGRFQDADESAYYEYRCRRADIEVHYCAELFPNDGSVTTALLKALKRAMAAEYSRELSVKVFAGKARLTEMGFWQGGQPGYGFRRLLVDHNGNPKFVLKPGERKSIATDRIVLIPGPADELNIVRKIFKLYASGRHSCIDIAQSLNDRGIPCVGGRCWTRSVIREIVTNPKYAGDLVCGRRSGKLRTRRAWNPPEMWIWCKKAIKPIIDTDIFRKSEAVAQARSAGFTKERLLLDLRKLLKKRGTITARMISGDAGMACLQTYAAQFGSLMEAYRQIGFEPPDRDMTYLERERQLLPIRRKFTTEIIQALEALRVPTVQNSRSKLLELNGKITVRVTVSQCRQRGESWYWRLLLSSPNPADVTVVARLAPGNKEFLDYFCLPQKAYRGLTQMTIREGDQVFERFRTGDRAFIRKLAKKSKAPAW